MIIGITVGVVVAVAVIAGVIVAVVVFAVGSKSAAVAPALSAPSGSLAPPPPKPLPPIQPPPPSQPPPPVNQNYGLYQISFPNEGGGVTNPAFSQSMQPPSSTSFQGRLPPI